MDIGRGGGSCSVLGWWLLRHERSMKVVLSRGLNRGYNFRNQMPNHQSVVDGCSGCDLAGLFESVSLSR